MIGEKSHTEYKRRCLVETTEGEKQQDYIDYTRQQKATRLHRKKGKTPII